MGLGFSFCRPEYHPRYSDGTIKLVMSRGGRRGKLGSEHSLIRYKSVLSEILSIVETLANETIRLQYDYYEDKPLLSLLNIWELIDDIRRKYEDFFCDSFYAHDRAVDERKKIVRDAFFDLEWLRDDIDAVVDGDPNFRVIDKRIRKQLKAVVKLVKHARGYYPEIVFRG